MAGTKLYCLATEAHGHNTAATPITMAATPARPIVTPLLRTN